MRFDKWLWAARFYRTRALAALAIEAGHVRVDDQRIKPSRGVAAGDRIVLRKDGLVWNIVVAGLTDRRGSAASAAGLYREAPDSIAARAGEIARRKAAATAMPMRPGRPTKRERRKLKEFFEGG
ncbi:MAG: S4 domain-containing protein [Betaproteobacteria bacterium]